MHFELRMRDKRNEGRRFGHLDIRLVAEPARVGWWIRHETVGLDGWGHRFWRLRFGAALTKFHAEVGSLVWRGFEPGESGPFR